MRTQLLIAALSVLPLSSAAVAAPGQAQAPRFARPPPGAPPAANPPAANPPAADPPAADPAGSGAVNNQIGPHAVLLDPISHGNLTLFPIVSTARRAAGPTYMVLDEGMKKGLVTVVEDHGGEVNQLVLRNRSRQPLFLMAGEVVIGGRQDRIIGKNTIVAPRTTEEVPVFCVEHGRWNGRKASFASADTLAHTTLRKKASFGDQGQVWQEVAHKNAERKLENQTGTYRRVALDKSVTRSIAEYKRVFSRKLLAADRGGRMVGFAVALDGKVVAIESFSSPRLFHKLRGKLLRSYYVEAVNHAYDAAHPPATPAAAQVIDLASKSREARPKVTLDKASGKTVQFEDGDVQGSEVQGAQGAPVYRGTFK